MVRSYLGWTGNFYLEDEDCIEIYYKKTVAGGVNNSWVDDSDIHYHISHGTNVWDSYYGEWLTGVLFEDGNILLPSEARLAWGDTDSEFMGFRNCQMLEYNSRWRWADAMNGHHLILGFETNSYLDDDFGWFWAARMHDLIIWIFTFPATTVTQAWFDATDITHGSGTVACVIAETFDCYSDYLWGGGSVSSDPIPDGVHWSWAHPASSPPYRSVNNMSTMNVYEIVPRDVNEAYIRNIGAAFGMGGGPILDEKHSHTMIRVDDPNRPRILEVFKDTGYYYYRDLGKLRVLDPCVPPFTESQAEPRAQDFLVQKGLFPSDAGAFDVEYDQLVRHDSNQPGSEQSYLQNCATIYAREIEGTAGQLVSVAGPAAKVKVYIHADGQIMGAMGNWRRIRKNGEVQVMTKEETWSLFEEYGQRIDAASVYVKFDQAVPNLETATQAYYEYSALDKQIELIPVWIYEVDYYLKGRLTTTADTFVPAARNYCPPVVKITTPADGSVYDYGQTITFDCNTTADFGTPPYKYYWKSNVDDFLSSSKGFLSNSLSINCLGGSTPGPQKIKVTVTDSKGLQSTDMIRVMIRGECLEDEEMNPADSNRDGKINMTDLAMVASAWLRESGRGEGE